MAVVRYDYDESVTITPRFHAALVELMKAEVAMMRESLAPEYWYWGRCWVGDMSSSRALLFKYGQKDSLPDDDLGRFGVIYEEEVE